MLLRINTNTVFYDCGCSTVVERMPHGPGFVSRQVMCFFLPFLHQQSLLNQVSLGGVVRNYYKIPCLALLPVVKLAQ